MYRKAEQELSLYIYYRNAGTDGASGKGREPLLDRERDGVNSTVYDENKHPAQVLLKYNFHPKIQSLRIIKSWCSEF